MRATLLVLLIISCREESFVAETLEEPTQTETADVTKKTPKPSIISESIPSESYFQLPPQLFTLNPHGEERSETVGLIKKMTITMESLTRQHSETINSPSRTLHHQSFVQTGRAGTPRQDDQFRRQRDKGLLDLLLVIDDSSSMEGVHTKMVDNLMGLLSQIENSNWKINIVDVDENQLCNHTIIDRNNKVPLYAETLQALVNSPNINERAIVKARVALGLDRSCSYRWMRDGSTLAAIIITNEDHQCTNRGAADNRGTDSNSFLCGNEVGEFISAFRNLRPNNTRLYGIFNTESTCAKARNTQVCYIYNNNNSILHCLTTTLCYNCPQTNPCYSRGDNDWLYSKNYLAPGSNAYDQVTNINEENYSSILQSISANIHEILQDQFTLSYTPANNSVSVEVLVNGSWQPVTTGYQLINGNILEFTSDPGSDTIKVSYLPTDGSEAIPYISALHVGDTNADLSTARVTISGRTLTLGSDYSVRGQVITLNGDMSTVFPSGATAVVYYHRHQTKQRSFTFATGKEIDENSVQVVGASDRYTVRNNRIEFHSGHEPNYGSTFSVGYRYYIGNKMNYPINVRYNVDRVECDSGVSCEYNNNNIVVTSGFRRGSTFTATVYPVGEIQEENNTDLPINYITGSLCLARELNHCQQEDNGPARPACDGRRCCSERQGQLVIDNTKIMLTTANADGNGCALLGPSVADIGQLQLHYQTYTPQQQIVVSNSPLIEYVGQYEKEKWEVFVVDQKKVENTDYTIDKSKRTIDFKGQYPVDSKISVIVHLK